MIPEHDTPQTRSPAPGKLFRVLWWFDALIAAVFLLFFVIGLADGSVSSFNMGLWLTILAALAGVLWGSRALLAAGERRFALGLLWLLAVPGIVGALFMLIILIAQPRWN